MQPAISVIIPTYNETEAVVNCIQALQANSENTEIIVADSPSSTVNLKPKLKHLKCTYFICERGGRNHQMNEGAAKANSNILYFVHADTIVHPDFEKDIINCVDKFDLGSYAYRFDHYPSPLLHINAAFTQLPFLWCRGGDQTLFVKKSVFEALGGYCKKHVIMEDYDFLMRAKQGNSRFKLFSKKVTVSARKYDKNGYFKVQIANLNVMRKWLTRESSPEELLTYYRSTLK